MPPQFSRPDTKTFLTVLFSVMTPQRCLSAAILFFILMVILGAIPGEAHALSEAVHDKLLHFLAYTVLSALIYASFTGQPATRAFRTVMIVGSLGALDEAIQALMPYRDANWMDWRADMMASLSSVTLLAFLHVLYSQLAAQTTKTSKETTPVVRPDPRE